MPQYEYTSQEPYPVGTRVKHCGTKMWGTVIGSMPSGRSYEYEVQRDEPLFGSMEPTWWGSHHIMMARKEVKP